VKPILRKITIKMEAIYPDAFEEADVNVPEARFDELAILSFLIPTMHTTS
jgi:hypothetical protein